MDNPISIDLGRIAQDLQIRRVQVESVVQLLDEGNTVPFITRYRKERTGNLNEVAIREIQNRVGRLRDLAERKETILRAVEAQGKLTDELRDAIRAADNPKRLEDLYLPYKPKKKSKASDARERGLEPLALRIWTRDETLTDLPAAAQEYINPEKELDAAEKVLEGVGHILSESINELASVRDAARRVVWKTGKIATTKGDLPEGEGLEYRDYFAFSEPIAHVPPHRVLAINRGDKEGALKVKLDVPRSEIEKAVFGQVPLDGHPQADFFGHAVLDAIERLLLPSLEREVRRDLTEGAERHAVDVFARNLRSLLLQPPIPKQVVLAIDPGFRTGCKVTILDGFGNMLDHGVMHPHPPQNRRHEAKLFLKDLVAKHQVAVVAIGNGTACRETEELVAEIISEGTYFHEHPEATTMPGVGGSAPTAPPAEQEHPTSTEAADQAASPSSAAPEESPSATLEPSQDQGSAPEPPQAATTPSHDAVSSEPAEGPAPHVDDPSHTGHDHSSTVIEGGNGQEAAGSPVNSSSESDSRPPSEVEEMPPIMGGAPDDETHGQPESGPGGGDTAVEHHPEAANEHHTPSAEEPAFAPEASITATQAETTPSAEHQNGDGGPSELPENVAAVASVEAPEAEKSLPETAHESEGEATAGAEGPATESAPPVEAKSPTPTPQVPSPSPFTAPPVGAKPSRPPQAPRPPKPKGPPPKPKPHPGDAQLSQLAYVIVNEAGASVYSTSPVGREEFPEHDATLRGTISIGRRLQDPLAELVKIEPQNIGVGLYQHDVNPKHLKESLESVIESCVNFVGVDLNTASVPLLRHVSGLNQLTARRVVDRRKEKGAFTDREQLKEVDGIGAVTFTQAAGFLKIRDAANPLDRTWVHPESYAVAQKVLEKLGFTPDVILDRERLPELHAKMNEADVPALAQEMEVGAPTLHDIFEALARPDRDPRDDLPKPIFKKGVLKLEDLSAGMELKGTVLNVVDFGAFVDIGLKDSGLVHISQLANRYIKSPHDVVSVGDVVTIWVMGVDQERKRVSLTMVKPGSERPRGAAGGGGAGRRGGPEGGERERGGERRSGQRPPRREGAGPQPQSAGAAPGSPGEGQASRGDRPAARGGEHRPGSGGGGRSSGPPQRGPGGGRGPQRQGGPGGAYGSSQSRMERAQAPRPTTVKPNKPAPPPAPLSKEALTGGVPLRTFGQLKQLWQARVDDPADDQPPAPSSEESQGTPDAGPPQTEHEPDPRPSQEESSS